MLKKSVNYTDYDGNPAVAHLYFNLNKFEWLELETYTKGGLIKNLESALETSNTKKIIDLLKKIILRAYGEKNPETGAFEKDDDRAVRFSKTEIFSALFFELAYNAEESKAFFMGLIPAEVREKAAAEMAAQENNVVPIGQPTFVE